MSSPPVVADRRIIRRGMAILGMAIREQPKPFAVAVAGAALYGGMTVAASVVVGEVTDEVVLPALSTGSVERAALAIAATAIIGVGVLKALGIVVRRIAASYMQYRLHADFRTRIVRQYQRLSLSWHRRHTTGELLSNANADVEATFWPIAPLPFAVGVAFLLAITAVVLMLTDLFLAAVGLIVAPAIALVNIRYNRLIKQPATRAQQHRADVSSVAHESFDGALIVKTLGREHEETQRFAHESARLRDELMEFGRLRAVFDPLVEALPNAGILLVLLVGAWRIAGGELGPGELVRVAYLFTLLAFPLRIIGFLLGELPRSVVGWERVERVLSASDDLAYGNGDLHGDDGVAVDVEAVSFRYDRQPVLTDVSFAAAPGRTVAIVGPTGVGKSTIASLLVRLADPHTGSVQLDGAELRSLAAGVLPRDTAIVFQHSFLFDDSVWDNITLGAPHRREDVYDAARLAQAHDFICELPDGYDTVVGERGATLSGGQRQRVALARALVRRPRLLILDDATSSVDTTVEQAILAGLRDADLPSTLVVVAYRRATIALADEVVFVEGGRVRAHGAHQQLLATEPAYARLLTAYDDPPSGWDPVRR